MAAPVTTQLHTMADAIEARLRLGFPAVVSGAEGFFVRTMSASPDDKELDRVFAQKPGIGIAWAGFPSDPQSGRTLHGRALWHITLVCANAQSAENRMRGDSRGIGLFGMVWMATSLLHGWTLDDIGTASVLEATPAYADGWKAEGVAMAMIAVSIPLVLTPIGPAAGTDLDDFLRLNSTWDISPNSAAGEPVDLNNMRA